MRVGSYLSIGALVSAVLMPVAASATNYVQKISFEPSVDESKLYIFVDKNATPPSVKEDPRIRQLVVELSDAQLPARLTEVIDLAGQQSPIVQITPYNTNSQSGMGSKLVLKLRERINYQMDTTKDGYVLRLSSLSTATAKKFGANENDLEKISSRKAEAVTEGRRIRLTKAWIETDTVRSYASAEDKFDQSAEVAKQLEETLNSGEASKQYRGSKVNFEANDADVYDIFKLVGAASGLNILTGSDVAGKVNLSLKDIPWDQLLDVVLQQLQLRIAVTGNVVRVLTLPAYNRELDDRKRALALAQSLEPVIMAIVPVSFAKAEDMKKMIETLLARINAPVGSENTSSEQSFERGKIEIDTRSNSLIITNTSKAINRIKRLLKELDVPMPQILIESKIIVASETFTRGLGVTWAAQQSAGARGLAGGGLSFNGGAVTTPVAGPDAASASAFAVTSVANNIGAGIALGAGSRANLAVALSLGEANSLAKTVASPKIIVNNKVAATINDTQSATYTTQSTSQGGVANETKFISLPLSLTVTPQITNAASVLMDLNVTKGTLENANGASSTKTLSTQVLVDSGSTLVLGGVYQFQSNRERNGIPFLKDLPILGFLFRSESENEAKSELLVFITPKILDTGASGLSNQM